MCRGYQLGVLVYQGFLNFRRNDDGNFFAVNLALIKLDEKLLIAERASDSLLPLAHPSSFGPFELADLVWLWRPICDFLECSEAAEKLGTVARTIFGSNLGCLLWTFVGRSPLLQDNVGNMSGATSGLDCLRGCRVFILERLQALAFGEKIVGG